MASPSPVIKHMLYSEFLPRKPPIVMPLASLVLAESSRSHSSSFEGVHAISKSSGVCWEDEICTGHRCLGVSVACGDSPGFSGRSVERLKN